jgi:hypothetical protein
MNNNVAKEGVDCKHDDWYNIFDTDTVDQGEKVLVKRICNKCHVTQEKPDGPKTSICPRCWSRMIPDSVEAHGPIGDKYYVCENPKCGYIFCSA